MKTIGLLGGMSWESSIEYERLINEGVRRARGATASADLIIRSYDFSVIEAMQEADDWDGAGRLLASDAKMLEAAGADVVLLCTNTMHRVADVIEAALEVPFLHLADATAQAVNAQGVQRVGLLGTRYTMEHDFYRGRLEAHGLDVIVPDEADRGVVHAVIYDELVRGITTAESKAAYLAIIDRLVGRGAQGVIAGCTEIELLVGSHDVAVPYFATTRLHAEAAVRFAVGSIGEGAI
ncbi:MAG: aspartate/glutamate racemase family protein [Acidimicrobiales bacterium]|nr:aspartate/glutamate racemase family protein [Acidimicrobiales bacterium]